MAISYIDTERVEEIKNDLSNLNSKLNDEINSFFNRMLHVPNVTGEWVGQKSVYYFHKAAVDKKQYVKFIESLKMIETKLNIDLNEIQAGIKNNNTQESQRW